MYQVQVRKNTNGLPVKRYSLDPINKPERWNWNDWQLVLKTLIKINQNSCCAFCHKKNASDLHHALFTRKDVQGLQDDWRIHHTYNCLVLCRNCHKNVTREQCAIKLYELYGKSVIEWYNQFNVKWNKPNLFKELKK